MTNIFMAVFAYLIDKFFGEFPIKHPVEAMGEMITFFEERYYEDSVARGILLVLFITVSLFVASMAVYLYLDYLPTFLTAIISSVIASMFIAHNMLYNSVKDILSADDKKEALSMLVSRDVDKMSESDIYKASIETYAENLSDGVVAPILYLVLFGLPGIIVYKAINTMDSMVGYKNKKYANYGKAAAVLDDIVNYIPARLTAILIMIISKQTNFLAFYEDGAKHDSPNAGHPITAMALAIDVKLGGDAYYFGELKKKPFFGDGNEIITEQDVKNALNLGKITKL
ncbi:adenosylcobinamide-phosphate synthase CbiB [Sulfurimonas sp.]